MEPSGGRRSTRRDGDLLSFPRMAGPMIGGLVPRVAQDLRMGLGWGDLTGNELTNLGLAIERRVDEEVSRSSNSSRLRARLGARLGVPVVKDHVLLQAVAESIVLAAYPDMDPDVALNPRSWTLRPSLVYSGSGSSEEAWRRAWRSTRTPLSSHQIRHTLYAHTTDIQAVIEAAASGGTPAVCTPGGPPMWPLTPPPLSGDLRRALATGFNAHGGYGDITPEEYASLWNVCGEVYDGRGVDWIVYGVLPQFVMTRIVVGAYPEYLAAVDGDVKALMDPSRWWSGRDDDETQSDDDDDETQSDDDDVDDDDDDDDDDDGDDDGDDGDDDGDDDCENGGEEEEVGGGKRQASPLPRRSRRRGKKQKLLTE